MAAYNHYDGLIEELVRKGADFVGFGKGILVSKEEITY